MVLPAIGMAVAGSAWNWWEQDSAYKRQEKSARNAFKIQEQERFADYLLNKQQVEKANAYTLKIWDEQLRQYDLQKKYNRDAFTYAVGDAQQQFNQQLMAAMYQSDEMRKQLMQVEGRAAASGTTSESALRAEAIESTGEFGRQKAIQQQNLIGNEAAMKRALEQVTKEYNYANEMAYAQVAVPPELQTIGAFQSGQYQSPGRPDAWMTGFNSVVAGLKASAPFVPEAQGGFFGTLQNIWGGHV